MADAIDLAEKYLREIEALRAELVAERRTLPCGCHHSLDDSYGGCVLCTARTGYEEYEQENAAMREQNAAMKRALQREAGYQAERCACVYDGKGGQLAECDEHRDLRHELARHVEIAAKEATRAEAAEAALATAKDDLICALRERNDECRVSQAVTAERDALRALMKLPDDCCLACGGQGGHDEGCRGTTALIALRAEITVLKRALQREAGYLPERCACIYDGKGGQLAECDEHRDLRTLAARARDGALALTETMPYPSVPEWVFGEPARQAFLDGCTAYRNAIRDALKTAE